VLHPHQPLFASQGKPIRDVRSALGDGIAQLEREHVPSAALAAELLLMHVLQRDRAWIYAHPGYELDAAAREKYFSLIARRASGVPTQHLTGHQEFWGLDFEVTPDVLIPRPETEHLIEVALEQLVAQAFYPETLRRAACGGWLERDRSRIDQTRQAEACPTKQFRIADVGTGSGCIAIALAHELPAARITATDVSAKALAVARRNAAHLGVAERITFVECNLLEGVLHGSRATGHASHGLSPGEPRSFDLIASNPPYIGHREAATLPREVREHEPETALFGGEIGTELYQPLITQAAALLKPRGHLVLELGYNSPEHVMRALGAPEWTSLSITNDLAGIPRVACAERTAEQSSA
jgi:release factor glutamine methyltransferase